MPGELQNEKDEQLTTNKKINERSDIRKTSALKEIDENYSKAQQMIFGREPIDLKPIENKMWIGKLRKCGRFLINFHKLNSLKQLESRIEEFQAFFKVRLNVEATLDPDFRIGNDMMSKIKNFLLMNERKIKDGNLDLKTFSSEYSDMVNEDPANVHLRTALLICYYSLELALQKAQCLDFDSAWTYYHLADRNFIRLDWKKNCILDSKYPNVLANALWVEAEEKLEPWKKEKVKKLLFNAEKVDEGVSVERIVQAKRIIDDQDENVQFKANSIQWQLTVLGGISSFLLVASLVLFSYFDLYVGLGNLPFILSLCVFGAIGGSISGIFSFSKISLRDSAEIPSQSLSAWLTIIRPLVGAVSALVIAVFVLSGLMDFGEISTNQLLAVAFISGFSERLILGAADKMPK